MLFSTFDAIELRGVTHHFGARPVLRDIDLHVAAGECLVLVAPNGMGKTTLLALMAGALAPIRGEVWIAGTRRRESADDELRIRRSVAYLPAEAWLPKRMTGRAWVLAVGRTWGVDEDRLLDHTERLLELFDLGEQADRPLDAYSTGQRKKLALCGTLATDAPILILDEPFSGGLDPSGILALQRIIRRRDGAGANGAARTIVCSTPVSQLVEELADRVALLKDGRLAAVDTIDGLRRTAECAGGFAEVYERLMNPFTLTKMDRYFEVRP